MDSKETTIETKTRTRTETEVVEHEEEYEVVDCQWCDGEHPTDETVLVGLGMEDEEVEVGHAKTDGVLVSPTFSGAGDHVNVVHLTGLDKVSVSVDVTVPQDERPFCAWCANEVFDLDVDTVLDAPAYEYYDHPTPPARSTEGLDSLFDEGYLAAFFEGIMFIPVLILAMLKSAPGQLFLFGLFIIAGTLTGYFPEQGYSGRILAGAFSMAYPLWHWVTEATR